MKKSEIFQTILEVVCDCMELTPNVVLSSDRTDDAVMARCMIASFGKDFGLSNKHLQQFLHFKSHSSVGYLLRTYAQRKACDRHFRFYASTAAHELDKTMAKLGL